MDLAVVVPHKAIFLCPANHSPPTRVAPYPGYEAVATCVASPSRAGTHRRRHRAARRSGVVAFPIAPMPRNDRR